MECTDSGLKLEEMIEEVSGDGAESTRNLDSAMEGMNPEEIQKVQAGSKQ